MSNRRFAPYLPLIAAAAEIPWMIVVGIAMFVTVGDAPQPHGTGLNLSLWSVIGVIPAALGIAAAVAGIFLRWPRTPMQWVWLALGGLVCLAMTLQWGTPDGIIA